MTRRRIARIQRLAGNVRASMRRRRNASSEVPDQRTADELERRLDATRDRLRRENPQQDDEPAERP